ncbi:uncharacterized protein [Clytia hemisphaerica]|uniref:Cnidarian restricted protein n=1 Tax=Clytia hemisphaerica TaxID=252671 RepID=A0A7M5V8P1_9CNID
MKTLFTFTTLTLAFVCRWTWAADDIEYPDLTKCPIQVQPMGCYRDKDTPNRALPDQIANSRDPGSTVFMEPNLNNHWGNFAAFLANFICQCAKKAAKEKRGQYIGIQYYAECWSGEKDTSDPQSEAYKKYGEANAQCIDNNYEKYDGSKSPCGLYAGTQLTNYVYKITELDQDVLCPLHFKPMGCYNDNQVKPRPLPDYIMNERDYTLPNWNGHIIDWNGWDKYMPALICRCAMAAKKGNYKYFGIQFYGECWAGNDEKELKKDGDADKDKCLVKLGAPPYGQYCPSKSEQEGMCHPQLCVGVQKTNYVYEMLQGPGPCSKNPCKPNEKCIPNPSLKEKFKCEESPFEEKDPEKKPEDDPTKPPSNNEPSNEKPVSTEPKDEKPTSTEPKNEKPASTEPSNEKPASTEPKDEKPTSTEPKDEKPASTEPKDEKPASTEPKDEKPTSTEPKDEKPASTEPSNEKPASVGPKDEKPASTEPKDENPASTEPKDEKSESTEPKDEKPASTEPSNEKPASTEPTNEIPASTETKDEKPTSTEPKNENPASIEPNNQDLNKYNPQPTQGNRMPLCCNTNTCNRVTKSLWCHKGKM